MRRRELERDTEITRRQQADQGTSTEAERRDAARILNVELEHVMSARRDPTGVLFAVLKDGRKMEIEGKRVRTLVGPGADEEVTR